MENSFCAEAILFICIFRPNVLGVVVCMVRILTVLFLRHMFFFLTFKIHRTKCFLISFILCLVEKLFFFLEKAAIAKLALCGGFFWVFFLRGFEISILKRKILVHISPDKQISISFIEFNCRFIENSMNFFLFFKNFTFT